MLDYEKLQSSAQIPTQVQPPTEWKEVEVELIQKQVGRKAGRHGKQVVKQTGWQVGRQVGQFADRQKASSLTGYQVNRQASITTLLELRQAAWH